MSGSIDQQLRYRLSAVGLSVPGSVVDRCARYLELMRRWNVRLNLTALALSDPVPTHTLDRLLIEPLLAARWVETADRVVDLGSGGGSPALPLQIAAQPSSLTMVESRGRKCAFLREAARVLELPNVSVLQSRFEDLLPVPTATCVTIRAVRLDPVVVGLILRMLAGGGTAILFGGQVESPEFVEVDSILTPLGEPIRRYRVEG